MNEDYTNYGMEEELPASGVGRQFLGAAIGMVVGIAAYCLMGLIGYIWWYLGLVFGFAVYFCYMKFAKTVDLTGIVICCIAILVGIYAGVHMCYAVYFYDWRPDMLFCITQLYTILNQYDMIPDFIKNLLLSYVCGFAGIISILRGNSRNNSLEMR